MIIYDEKQNIIENPNLDLGYILEECIPVWHIWIGDDWGETVDKDGKPVPYGEVTIPIKSEENPDGINPEEFDNRIPDHWLYGIYIPYTQEELEKQAEEKKLIELTQKAQEWLPYAPEKVEALEFGVDDNYEATAELGVAVADHDVTLDDIMEAIAELGVELEALNG